MSSWRRLSKRVKKTAWAASDSYDYARHLVQGNRVMGDVAWMREHSRPVVLVHGFLGTRGTMLPLARRLQSDGFVTFNYSYGTFQTGSLRASAEGLIKDLRRIRGELGVEKFDVVAFSMGGLVAVHALKYLQGHEMIDRVVTLGSPFAGTWVGVAGVAALGALSPSVWQVLPGSPFLQELRDAPLHVNTQLRQIHGKSDRFCPAPGPIDGVTADNYILVPGGHASLVVAPHVYDYVRDFLVRDDARASQPARGDNGDVTDQASTSREQTGPWPSASPRADAATGPRATSGSAQEQASKGGAGSADEPTRLGGGLRSA